MLTFADIDPDAERVLTFDFSKALTPTETLIGTPIVHVTVSAGTDLNPANILIAPAQFDGSGLFVLQPVGNLSGRNGNDYEFEAISACTSVDKIVVVRAILPVRSS